MLTVEIHTKLSVEEYSIIGKGSPPNIVVEYSEQLEILTISFHGEGAFNNMLGTLDQLMLSWLDDVKITKIVINK